jgi:nucleotide-binding universal stress UspA family protein
VLHIVRAEEPRGLALEQRVWRAESHLRARVADVLPKPQVRVRVGHAARRVVEQSCASPAPTSWCSAHTRHRPSCRAIRRGIAERVLDDTRRPVLIVRHPPEFEYGRVMLALDLSDESAAALRLTESLAFAGEDVPFVVHAYHPPYEGMLASIGVGFDKLDTHAQAWRRDFATGVREFLRRHSQDPWRYRLIMAEDRPVPGILAVAGQTQPDLLVLGARAQGPLLRTLFRQRGPGGGRCRGPATCCWSPRASRGRSRLPDASASAQAAASTVGGATARRSWISSCTKRSFSSTTRREHERVHVLHAHAAVEAVERERDGIPPAGQRFEIEEREAIGHHAFTRPLRGRRAHGQSMALGGLERVDHVQVVRPGLGPVFPGMHAGVSADEIVVPVRRRAGFVVTLERAS